MSAKILLRPQTKKERFAGSTMGKLTGGFRTGFIHHGEVPDGWVLVNPGEVPVYDHPDQMKPVWSPTE